MSRQAEPLPLETEDDPGITVADTGPPLSWAIDDHLDDLSRRGQHPRTINAYRRILYRFADRFHIDTCVRELEGQTFAPTYVLRKGQTTYGHIAKRRPFPVELQPIGLHECRHTFVSLMHAAGRALEEIGDYVGHTSAYMAECHRHLLDGARADAADALDALPAGGGAS